MAPGRNRSVLVAFPGARPEAPAASSSQSYTLGPWLTVRDNVCFGLAERGSPRVQQMETANAFIHKVGLSGFENHFPKQRSGGVQ